MLFLKDFEKELIKLWTREDAEEFSKVLIQSLIVSAGSIRFMYICNMECSCLSNIYTSSDFCNHSNDIWVGGCSECCSVHVLKTIILRAEMGQFW